jgi:hypothetical protein
LTLQMNRLPGGKRESITHARGWTEIIVDFI